MIRLKVFISSVQKELREERRAIGSLLATDPFLVESTVPRIFEDYPAPLRPNPRAYLDLLRTCHIYILVIGREYGRTLDDSGLSPTHEEYNEAQKRHMPTLVLLKGKEDSDRSDEAKELFASAKSAGHTYTRFGSLEELQEMVRARLVEHLQTTYDADPTPLQQDIGENSLHTASYFERQLVSQMTMADLEPELTVRLASVAEARPREQLDKPMVERALLSRGYLWWDDRGQQVRPTCAGVLLMATRPSVAFPQARLQMDAFTGDETDPNPYDSVFIDAPLPKALEQAVAFVRRNTAHPLVVKGLRRIDTSAYPEEALREGIVNALAHRDYSNGAAKIVIELFRRRLQITSPGLPPGGQPIELIAEGRALSRPRNPLVVQGLTWLDLMDDRGSGIKRMRAAMAERNLDPPEFGLEFDAITLSLTPEVAPEVTPEVTGQVAAQGTAQVYHAEEETITQIQKAFIDATGQDTGQVTGQVAAQVLEMCREARAAREIQGALGLKHRETFLNNYLKPLLRSGWIEMTIPDKPNSSKQKYRLTAKGEAVRKKLVEKLG